MSERLLASQSLIYRAENSAIQFDARFEGQTVWLTHLFIAELSQTTKQKLGQYLKNIFDKGELAQAMRRIATHMQDWITNLDGFLSLNDCGILTHSGKISHELANQCAEQAYDGFHQQRFAEEAAKLDDFEMSLKIFPQPSRETKIRFFAE